MATLPEAVTFDFHDTIATCDQWFQLEIRDLVPAFLRWHSTRNGMDTGAIDYEQAVQVYRRVRLEIMEHGLEKDAVTAVDLVTRELGHPVRIDDIELGVEAIMRATLDDSLPVAGVVESVKCLREQGIRLGVVSSAAYHPFLEWSLDKFGILDDFDVVVTSASCGFYKSRTEIYSCAADQLGADPERIIHVGDSERFDVATASRTGMRTILYDPGRIASAETGATAVVHTLKRVDRVIQGLYRGNSA